MKQTVAIVQLAEYHGLHHNFCCFVHVIDALNACYPFECNKQDTGQPVYMHVWFQLHSPDGIPDL